MGESFVPRSGFPNPDEEDVPVSSGVSALSAPAPPPPPLSSPFRDARERERLGGGMLAFGWSFSERGCEEGFVVVVLMDGGGGRADEEAEGWEGRGGGAGCVDLGLVDLGFLGDLVGG